MVGRRQVQVDRDQFAIERSHKAAEISYAFSKFTAQACLLINGGAATAVIAFLTRDKIDIAVNQIVPWCVVGFAAGVLSSAIMLFCEMMNADYWNYYWYYLVYVQDDAAAERSEKIADWWHFGFYVALCVNTLCFIVASGLMAYALLHARPIS